MNEDDTRRLDAELPPRPEPPDPMDCCGGGCVPCIFDLYEEALIEWQQEVAEIEARSRSAHQRDQQDHEQHHDGEGN